MDKTQLFEAPLSKWQRLSPGQIAGAKQPSSQARSDMMGSVARGGLLSLRIDGLFVTDKQAEQLRILQSKALQRVPLAGEDRAADLHDGAADRHLSIECR